jgi:hypothetical protein
MQSNSDIWVSAKEQAQQAMVSGAIGCALSSLVALLAPAPLAQIGVDALRMTLLLTACVPPAILGFAALLGPRVRTDP